MAKRLTDLFKVGRKVVFEEGDTVIEIWLQKLIPSETAQAIDRASAKRAKFLTVKSASADEEAVEYQRSELRRIYTTRDEQLSLAAAEDLARAQESVEAEIAAEEEWSTDDYFNGLKEAWESEVEARIQEGSESPEDQRVFAELKRFNDQVEKAYSEREADILRDFKSLSETALEDKAFSVFVDGQADGVWLREYRDCQVWLGTRDPADHSKLYFRDRVEVSSLSMEVLGKLISEYVELEVPPPEGKE